MGATLQRTEPVQYAPLTVESNGSRPQHVDDDLLTGRGVPTLALIGLAAFGTLLWSVVETSGRLPLVVVAALVLAGAASWSVALTLMAGHGRRRAERRGALMVAGLAALAGAAVVAGTVFSPFVLLIPVAIGFIVAMTGESTFADVALALGFTGLIGAGARATVWLDAPLSSSVLFLGSVGLLALLAYYLAGRLSRTGAAPVRATSGRPVRASAFTANQLDLLNSAATPIEVARAAADILDEVADPTYLAIVEQIPETDILRPLVERGSLDVDTDRLRSGLAALSHESLAHRQPRVLVNDGTNLDSIACRRLGVEAILLVPLRRMGTNLGVIHMAWTAPPPSELIDRAQALAANVSQWITPDIAISRVASEMERGYVNAIAAVCASLDEQSEFTSGHGHRVAKVALEIAELLVLSDHDQRQLLYVAEMHDLGQVGVDHGILAKPAALNDEEWTQVQTIPARGAGIVDPVSYFGEVSDAIRHLRERWDGQGYPDGLSGDDIPLLARVVAIAEAYDAMTSDRPYRDAMSPADALRQLWRERSQKYDPDIVEAFVKQRAPQATGRV